MDLFRKEDVGRRVWEFEEGWGRITAFDENNKDKRPVAVVFENGMVGGYTAEGIMFDDANRNRVLFWQEVPIPKEALTRPRWRAEVGQEYYYINPCGIIETEIENGSSFDSELFKSGNYFQTKQEAKDSKFYKVFHEEE